MERIIDNLAIECVEGDITAQPDIGIIVNAANGDLKGGGGVDGAINRAAGPELVRASRALGPIEPGQAVITSAFELPNDWVVHCVGPVYSNNPAVPEQLANCYHNALALAEDKAAAAIAFPAISAGVYGYPLKEAAEIAVREAANHASQTLHLKRIRFVLFGSDAYQAFETALGSM